MSEEKEPMDIGAAVARYLNDNPKFLDGIMSAYLQKTRNEAVKTHPNYSPTGRYHSQRQLGEMMSPESKVDKLERLQFHGGVMADGRWTTSYDQWKANMPDKEMQKRLHRNISFSVKEKPSNWIIFSGSEKPIPIMEEKTVTNADGSTQTKLVKTPNVLTNSITGKPIRGVSGVGTTEGVLKKADSVFRKDQARRKAEVITEDTEYRAQERLKQLQEAGIDPSKPLSEADALKAYDIFYGSDQSPTGVSFSRRRGWLDSVLNWFKNPLGS